MELQLKQLEGYLLDCPGQIELYSHIPVFKRVAAMLQGYGFNVRVAGGWRRRASRSMADAAHSQLRGA